MHVTANNNCEKQITITHFLNLLLVVVVPLLLLLITTTFCPTPSPSASPPLPLLSTKKLAARSRSRSFSLPLIRSRHSFVSVVRLRIVCRVTSACVRWRRRPGTESVSARSRLWRCMTMNVCMYCMDGGKETFSLFRGEGGERRGEERSFIPCCQSRFKSVEVVVRCTCGYIGFSIKGFSVRAYLRYT